MGSCKLKDSYSPILKIARVGQRMPGGSRETSNTFITVISAYTPTAKAPPHLKQQFFEDLQTTVDKVPDSDILILLGILMHVSDAESERVICGREL